MNPMHPIQLKPMVNPAYQRDQGLQHEMWNAIQASTDHSVAFNPEFDINNLESFNSVMRRWEQNTLANLDTRFLAGITAAAK